MLLAAGTPEETTDVVAGSLVEASLKGVDSHNVMQLPGEPERQAEVCRHTNGVPMPESVWQRLSEAAQTVGLDLGAVVKLDVT